MRATIELPDHLRAAVLAIAASKGYRGYSRVIVEAVELYLEQTDLEDSGLDRLLALRGAWSPEEAVEVREGVARVRENWRENAS